MFDKNHIGVSVYNWFFQVLLASVNSIPIQSLWVAFFTNPVWIKTNLTKWGQPRVLKTLKEAGAINTVQGAMGALFATAVNLPGDGVQVNQNDNINSPWVGGIYSQGRNAFEPLTISFVDTNFSFVEFNIRPWLMESNFRSLKDFTMRTNLVIMQLAKSVPKVPFLPRLIWTFHDVAPINIASTEYNYGSDAVNNKSVDFVYNYYTTMAIPGAASVGVGLDVVTRAVNNAENDFLRYGKQLVDTPKGGLTSHGPSQIKGIPSNDHTTYTTHADNQEIKLSNIDNELLTINRGLSILNGNSNVIIPNDDVVDHLRQSGEELLVNVESNDTPIHNTQTQEGAIHISPHNALNSTEDHITRHNSNHLFDQHIPSSGNSKTNVKGLADTPVYFPGDLEEGCIKVAGRNVVGGYDTPQGNLIPVQHITIDREDNIQHKENK